MRLPIDLRDHFLARARTSSVSHSAWSALGSKSSPIHSASSAWRSCLGSRRLREARL